ncbi:MAG: tetratricopeptide repeat protein [Phycisphaerae bacterium]|nr:tetratricopeptide repeat protein [Phycisphaerae bacterium]
MARLFSRRIGRLERRLKDRHGNCRSTLWQLTAMYRDLRCYDDARRCLERILELATEDGERVSCLLQLGANMEKDGDFEAAVGYYQTCCGMEPEDKNARYFAHNNLGFCLNMAGRFDDAEPHLHTAVRTDWKRHNAHKNLGLTSLARGRLREAAEAFITATELEPRDPRATHHLLELLLDNPELVEQAPHLQEEAKRCEQLIQQTAVQEPSTPGSSDGDGEHEEDETG